MLSLVNLFVSLYAAVITLVIGWLADIELRAALALIGGSVIIAGLLLRIDRVSKARTR